MSERTILVHVDLRGQPVLAGRLHMRTRRERESASFEYDPGWLAHPDAFALDPVHLPLARGAFHTAGGQKLFAGITDSAPDRWGRMLMQRKARLEGSRRTLFESDYLLMVDDASRQGALRFALDEHGPFLAHGEPEIPPLIRLGELLAASDRVQQSESDLDALRLLLAPGSSLGGARPKASVLGADGALSVAKFPAAADEWPVVVWEHVAFDLASAAGIDVPEARLVDVGGRRVLVTRRFDRAGNQRVPFLSGMALLGAGDGDDGHSYLELADAIRSNGVRVEQNLEQLWRRMVFNVLISNTDDHLRNHGFLREGHGWVLSPAYDLNPIPLDVKPRVHVLALDEASRDASVDTSMEVSSYFGLEARRAAEILTSVATAVSRWRHVARATGLDPASIDRMATAFEHQDLADALRGGG